MYVECFLAPASPDTLYRCVIAVELVTPPLDGMILPGVTRDSVLALARDHASGKAKLPGFPEKIVVSERPVTMNEVKAAAQSGHLVELFGTGIVSFFFLSLDRYLNVRFALTGTAAVISPVDRIGYLGEDILIPTAEDGMGPLSRPLWNHLAGIHTGAIKSDWSVLVVE